MQELEIKTAEELQEIGEAVIEETCRVMAEEEVINAAKKSSKGYYGLGLLIGSALTVGGIVLYKKVVKPTVIKMKDKYIKGKPSDIVDIAEAMEEDE